MSAQHSPKPLDGMLVVALEQAVAAPWCTSRLADAGARVIKIERPEGDFARGYDRAVHGESSYFVWINRGKESIALDLKQAGDLALLERMLAQADVFIQNLAPGATQRLGIGSDALRQRHPRLVTCDISGYGDQGSLQLMKAYDLLIQAESGLISISGAPGEWGRIGVSLCDITAGMNALIGIQQALFQRYRTGRGSGIKVSLFDSAAELMGVPFLQTRHGGKAPERVGLKHPTIAPYGAFTCADGRDILVSIQNEREWADFCREVLRRPRAADPPAVRQQCGAGGEPAAGRRHGGRGVRRPDLGRGDRPPHHRAHGVRQRELGAGPDQPSAAAHPAHEGQWPCGRSARPALDHRVGRRHLPRDAGGGCAG